MAKNLMKRSLNAVIDPTPKKVDIDRLWLFFDSSCAYCKVKLIRSERLGHLDHIVPHSAGGTNDIHNHVLSCSRCNGDEKREEHWESFLARKAPSAKIYAERANWIREWMSQAPEGQLTLSLQERQSVDAVIGRALQNFDAAVVELRAIRMQNVKRVK